MQGMKIVRIDLWHVGIPTPEPFRPAWIPGFLQTENRCTLVRVTTEGGAQGWSAGSAMGTERAGLGALLGPYLLGERADDLPSIRQRIREMGYLGWRCGWLEPACWDAVGRARGRPVWELLGGRPGRVKLYASTGEVRDGAYRVKEIGERLAEGFGGVKLRVHDRTLEEDLAQIRVARRGVGDAAVLGVDANQGWRVAVVADAPQWDFERALAFCREAEALGYSWVEEPLAYDAYDELARLAAAVQVPIAGGELNQQTVAEFRLMLEKKCLDVYQPDAVMNGGIAETMRIVRAVQAGGARYTPHTWTNGVGFAVNLAVFAASPWRDETLLEYPYDPPGWTLDARDGLLEQPFVHEKGTLELPGKPGLGFEISRKALRRHGRKFFTATNLRMAAYAVWDKGVQVARELGRVRDARLAARSEQVDAIYLAGGDPLRDALEG